MSISSVAGGSSAMSGIRSLFQNVEQNGGTITKDQLEQAASGSTGTASGTSDTSRADALFNKLDTNGDGVVDQSELQAAKKSHHHHHRSGGNVDGSTQSSLLQSQETANGTGAAASSTSATGIEILSATGTSDTTNQTLASLVLNLTEIVTPGQGG